MHFLRVIVTSYDAVHMIHDVITTANPFLYTAKFMFVGKKQKKKKTKQALRQFKVNP